MAVTLDEVFICSKLGQNLSEMEIRTFVRIQKVIWGRLLASKAEFIQKYAVFSFSCRKPCDEMLSVCSAVLLCFSLGLCCSPPRPVFRLNQLKKVRKRCSHSSLSSQAIILEIFGRNSRLCYVGVFRLLWATVASFVRSSHKKILNNSGFVRFR